MFVYGGCSPPGNLGGRLDVFRDSVRRSEKKGQSSDCPFYLEARNLLLCCLKPRLVRFVNDGWYT